MTEQAHLFFRSLLKANSVIRASGKKMDVAKFIYRYRELYSSHESQSPRGPSDATRSRHARNREERRQYLIDNADAPISKIAAELGVQERTAATLFCKLGVKRKWRN